MKNTEKRNLLQALRAADSFSESRYYKVLEKIGDMKFNYGDYMITEPIDCSKELERLPEADYNGPLVKTAPEEIIVNTF